MRSRVGFWVRMAAAASVLAASAPAQAAPDAAGDQVFNIMGPADCSRWPRRSKIDSAAKAVPLNWVLGFLSGAAEKSDPRLFDLLEPEKVGAWLDAYCQEHPAETLPKAVRALAVQLESELPPLPPPPPPMFFTPPPTAAKAPEPAPKAAAKAPAKRAPARTTTARRATPAKPAATKPAVAKPAAVAKPPAARPAATAAAPPALRR